MSLLSTTNVGIPASALLVPSALRVGVGPWRESKTVDAYRYYRDGKGSGRVTSGRRFRLSSSSKDKTNVSNRATAAQFRSIPHVHKPCTDHSHDEHAHRYMRCTLHRKVWLRYYSRFPVTPQTPRARHNRSSSRTARPHVRLRLTRSFLRSSLNRVYGVHTPVLKQCTATEISTSRPQSVT